MFKGNKKNSNIQELPFLDVFLETETQLWISTAATAGTGHLISLSKLQKFAAQWDKDKKYSLAKFHFSFYFNRRTRSKFSKKKKSFLNTCSENKSFRSTLSAKPTQHSANKGLSPERSLHNTEPSPHSQESVGRGLDVSTHSHDTSVCTLLIFSQRNIQKRAKILQRMNCISTQRSCIAYPATSRS